MGMYDNPPYYISAYGLAVKRGFLGSLDEWLASLVGPTGPQGGDFTIMGYFPTLAALETARQDPRAGDAYGIGEQPPYNIFVFDGERGEWIDNGVMKGEKGDTGDIGPQGEKGDTGAVGPQGEKGDTGEAGPQGERGDTGAVGPQGEKGDTGETGPQGEKGDTGEAGPQGEKGDTGAVGPQGEKGDTGEVGPQGEKGEVGTRGEKGDTGEKGSGFIILGYFPTLAALEAAHPNPTPGDVYGVGESAPYDICVWDEGGGEWINNGSIQGPEGLRGPQGEKGDTGEVGPQGEKGDTGEVGPRGEKGDTGEAGLRGEKGEKGDTGDIGPQGEKGDAGDVGPQGEKGDNGEAGSRGPQGEPGKPGEGYGGINPFQLIKDEYSNLWVEVRAGTRPPELEYDIETGDFFIYMGAWDLYPFIFQANTGNLYYEARR